ncbi:hypothetical protein H0E87_012741 [Populus deltoides]|nr:hypothetical protein H0E87_012741 [Populus deltoides]
MAKEVSGSRSWIEVAPAPIIYPRKPSNAPRLEPIAEEGHEEHDEDSQAFQKDLSSTMEKKIKDLSSWIEVTPALFISLRKTSSSPALETITEEEAEGGEDDD